MVINIGKAWCGRVIVNQLALRMMVSSNAATAKKHFEGGFWLHILLREVLELEVNSKDGSINQENTNVNTSTNLRFNWIEEICIGMD